MRKPNVHQHKLPSKTGGTEYSQRYANKQKTIDISEKGEQIDPPGVRFYFPSTQVTNLQSNYQVLQK